MSGCPYTHATWTETGWQPGNAMVLLLRERDGSRWRGYYAVCRHCGERTSALPKTTFEDWLVRFRLTVVPERRAVGVSWS